MTTSTIIEHRPTHPEGLNLEHWNMWLDDLATTDAPQAKGKLAREIHVETDMGPRRPIGFCCLGRACVVAGIPMEIDTLNRVSDPGSTETCWRFGHSVSLAPPELLDWLGLKQPGRNAGDILVAWPPEMRTNGGGMFEGGLFVDEINSATALNDVLHLTFSQIADVFRYFGTTGAS